MELPEQSSFLLLSAVISVKIPSLWVRVGRRHPEVLLLPCSACGVWAGATTVSKYVVERWGGKRSRTGESRVGRVSLM